MYVHAIRSLTKSLSLFHFHVVPGIGAIIPRGRANGVQIEGLNPSGLDLINIVGLSVLGGPAETGGEREG